MEENRAETKWRDREQAMMVCSFYYGKKKEYSPCPTFICQIHTGFLRTSTSQLRKQFTHVNSFTGCYAILDASMHFLVFCLVTTKLNLINHPCHCKISIIPQHCCGVDSFPNEIVYINMLILIQTLQRSESFPPSFQNSGIYAFMFVV